MPREGEAWSGRLAGGFARVGNGGKFWQQSNEADHDHVDKRAVSYEQKS